MEIESKLLKEIEDYCKLNGIPSVETEVNYLLRKGFNIERFGLTPFQKTTLEIPTEKVEESKDEEPPKKRGRKKKEEIPTEEQTVFEKPKEEEPPKKRKIRIIKN